MRLRSVSVPALALALPLAVALLGACARPGGYRVLTGQPGGLADVRDFAVEPLLFDTMLVGRLAEAEYEGRKTDAQRERYQRDKRMMSDEFFTRLADRSRGLRMRPAAQAAGGYTIRPVITFLEPGFYAGITASSTEIDMKVQILDPWGRVVDDVELRERVGAHFYSASRVGRLKQTIHKLADRYAAYLADRTGR